MSMPLLNFILKILNFGFEGKNPTIIVTSEPGGIITGSY
jgi:hypothetical protein